MGQESLSEPEGRKAKLGQVAKRGGRTGEVENRRLGMGTKVLRVEEGK